MNPRTSWKLSAAVIAISVQFIGCMSMQSQSTFEAIDGALNSALPFVEAYIEYPGPKEKWAGPTTFTLNVVARDAGSARIAFAPALFRPETEATTAGRAPAAQIGLSSDVAREHLAKLATALQGSEGVFSGCLSPVRVRLIRADGSLLDKYGCRGQAGWAQAVSDSVNYFLMASVSPRTAWKEADL
jgi:hypothetical protein